MTKSLYYLTRSKIEMMEKRKQRYEELRKTDMIEAAEVLFLDSGFEDTKMKDIAENAGYAKGTLYNYFDSKEDLFTAVVVKANQKLIKLTKNAIQKKEPGISQILAVGKAYHEFTDNFPRYASLIHEMGEIEQNLWTKPKTKLTENEKAYMGVNEEYAILFGKVIEQAKQREEIDKNIPTQLILISLASMTSGMLRELEHRNDLLAMNGFKKKEIVEFIFNLIKEALKAEIE
ncbi:MAG: TetR family transcriptional regulator [Candidatus Lokiarchaeota archaeon]|nr:TetR family transcriptional regulator [Candidatus Lokiarchaeota archaeon]